MIMSQFQLDPSGYRPKPPKGRKDYGIGLIGCGGIAHHAHLPGYQQMGFRVVACCDIRPDAVQTTQEKWDIPYGTTDYREILDHPDVRIVDIAIHQSDRVDIVRDAAQAGKHILIQKPLAHTMYGARAMIEAAERGGIKIMVNQQARFAPHSQAIARLLEQGAVGTLYQIEYRIHGNQDTRGWWYIDMPYAAVVDHGVHYIDLCRWWAGERTPERVCASFTYMHGQHSQYPMCYDLLMEFDPYLSAAHSFNNVTRVPGWNTSIRLEGTEGAILCDGSRIKLLREGSGEPVLEHTLEGNWFPDAFGGSMAELMDAITENREPWVSAQRNLGTIATAFAAVDSFKSGTFVRPRVD